MYAKHVQGKAYIEARRPKDRRGRGKEKGRGKDSILTALKGKKYLIAFDRIWDDTKETEPELETNGNNLILD